MNRTATPSTRTEPTALRIAVRPPAGNDASPASLPPTRAARSSRSRGAFLAGRGERGFVRGALSVVCVALTAASLLAAAPRMLETQAVTTNAALELVATTAQLPAIVCQNAN